jgi:hypothetical protein
VIVKSAAIGVDDLGPKCSAVAQQIRTCQEFVA